MSSNSSDIRVRKAVGPIRIRDTTLLFQLVGLFFAFVGVQVLSFGFDLLQLPLTLDELVRLPSNVSGVSRSPMSAAYHLGLGCFFICSGLGIGGVRIRFAE
ncbi:hypothetical protein [Haladaptatus caseinilyticus]|uniref:hypothetical protein n=1 Tax=Haladaptatus caseinilyticus TaxID=2993314 RepID=UPI00224B84FD|nr:hypothetical protein [Haladaptatus caseinilyticus]